APVPAHVEETLMRLGFRPRGTLESWLIAGPDRPVPEPVGGVRRIRTQELEGVVAWWAGDRERAELRRQLEVGMNHPNPGEEETPFVATTPKGIVASAALGYQRGECLDIEAVSTHPEHRGRGSATSLVQGILADGMAVRSAFVALRSSEPRLAGRLATLGFRVAEENVLYDLPQDAALQLPTSPAAAGAGPPLWRPRPRT
ncbi:MAG: hypothetical protein L3K08_05545, partial [Thermoplasmata archaeon]|nr:hypothetical protein [Thermoplasmata archaeon]